MSKLKLFATAWHPSAMNSLVPVLKRLNKDGKLETAVLGTKYSVDALNSANIPCIGIYSAFLKDYSVSSMKELLAVEKPDIVLAGASFQLVKKGKIEEEDIPDQTVVLAAKDMDIPSIRVHDGWKEMGKFTDKRTEKLEYIPDKVTVLDESAKKMLMEAGLPREVIYITGGPELEDLEILKKNFSEEKKQEIRKIFGMSDYETLFFYAGSIEWQDPESLGYSAFDNIKILTEAFKDIGDSSLGLMMNIHRRIPEKEKKEILNYVKESLDRRINFIEGIYDKKLCSGEGLTTEHVSLASDAVLTSFSTVGIKSAWLGIPTVSLQPNLILPLKFQEGEIHYFLENQDLIPLANDEATCKKAIQLLSFKGMRENLEDKLSHSSKIMKNGAENVVNLIYETLNISR